MFEGHGFVDLEEDQRRSLVLEAVLVKSFTSKEVIMAGTGEQSGVRRKHVREIDSADCVQAAVAKPCRD